MSREQFGIGAVLGGEAEGVALVSEEVPFERRVGGVRFERGAEDETQVFVERDQVAVEGGVVGGRQTEAVRRVHAVVCVVGPGDDVAGAQHLGHRQPREAAARAVVAQDHLAEKVLVHTRLDLAQDLFALPRGEVDAVVVDQRLRVEWLAAEALAQLPRIYAGLAADRPETLLVPLRHENLPVAPERGGIEAATPVAGLEGGRENALVAERLLFEDVVVELADQRRRVDRVEVRAVGERERARRQNGAEKVEGAEVRVRLVAALHVLGRQGSRVGLAQRDLAALRAEVRRKLKHV